MHPGKDSIRSVLDLIETMAEDSPTALVLLITSALNELRSAVDKNRADPELLRGLANHAVVLARSVPVTLQH